MINGEGAIRLLVSLAYWVLRRLFELVVLRLRSERWKELEILVPRQPLQVVQRQVARPRLLLADRVLLAAFSRSLPRSAWSSFLVSPATLLRWHRELVGRRWTYSRDPRTASGTSELVLQLARKNPTWGYRRIRGERVGLGVMLAPSTVWAILRRHGIELAPRRAELSWSEFLRAQASAIVACGFRTVDTVRLHRLYVLFFIELGSRRNHFGGVRAKPLPRMFDAYRLETDSFGAARSRGAPGVIKIWHFTHGDAVFSSLDDGERFGPWGYAGGEDAPGARIVYAPGTEDEVNLGVFRIGFHVEQGRQISFFNSGGGGFGDPLERPPEWVLADVEDEILSVDAAERDYGVLVRPGDRPWRSEPDPAATEALGASRQ